MQQGCDFKIVKHSQTDIYIQLIGRIDINTAPLLLKQIQGQLQINPQSLIVDLQQVSYFDDFGAILLFECKAMVPNNKFELIHVSSQIKEILRIVNFENLTTQVSSENKRSFGVFVRLGDSVIQNALDIKFMLTFIGSVILAFLYMLTHLRSLRVGDTITHMENTGVSALPIVALISFLLGLIMAFMSSLQLQQFGANIYVASLVSLAMVSELGPIMTAIIVAGRSGSAYAAEIGTMKISEEIDALTTMGFDPTLFLVIPRMVAAIVVVPLLTLFADLFAIFGGLIVGVFMLNLTAHSYINQTIETLTLFEVMWGVLKSVIFSILIAWIGCLRGFQARGGASSVGQAATSAVVSSIFLIVVFDSIFAIIRSYW